MKLRNILGSALLALLVAGIVYNFGDIKRYAKMTVM
jgi:hypothetical protein